MIEKMKEDKIIKKKAVKAEFNRQWEGVVKNYPLIAAAFLMREKKYAKTILKQLSSDNLDWVSILQPMEISDAVKMHIMRLSTCLRNLEIDLGSGLVDVADTFDRFGRFWRGEREELRSKNKYLNIPFLK